MILLVIYWAFASLVVCGLVMHESESYNRSINWFDYLCMVLGGAALPLLLGVMISKLVAKAEEE